MAAAAPDIPFPFKTERSKRGSVSDCFFYLESKNFPTNPQQSSTDVLLAPLVSCGYSPASRETRKAGLGFLASVVKLLSCVREESGQWVLGWPVSCARPSHPQSFVSVSGFAALGAASDAYT